jgi:hypothetical protein
MGRQAVSLDWKENIDFAAGRINRIYLMGLPESACCPNAYQKSYWYLRQTPMEAGIYVWLYIYDETCTETASAFLSW